jgi:hypothetical protein
VAKDFASLRAVPVAAAAASIEGDNTDAVALIAFRAAIHDVPGRVRMNFRKYHEMGTDRTKRLMQFGRLSHEEVAGMRRIHGARPRHFS